MKIQDSSAFRGLNTRVCGIDAGSREHCVYVHPSLCEKPLRVFGVYTSSIRELCEWLQSLGVKSVAIESTGLYWYGLYLMLESHEIEVCLVNAHHVKHVPGRKSDVLDSQWLCELHSYGLLRSSYQPSLETRALRAYTRQRLRLVSERNRSILHMQKAMDAMNIKLHEVLSDITGKSGLLIIQAILRGEHSAKILAELADNRVKKSKEQIARALEGFWQPYHLFELEQAYNRYKFYTNQIESCDKKIELSLQTQKTNLKQQYGKGEKNYDDKEAVTQSSKKKGNMI